MAKKQLPEHPRKHEEKYVMRDEITNDWGVFGFDSGFCYSTWSCREDAERELAEELEGIN